MKLDDYELLRVFMDGNAICITGPEFHDLQSSPAIFYAPGDWQYDALLPWMRVVEYPIIHLPLFEIANIILKLRR
jgi:hypothetical protein